MSGNSEKTVDYVERFKEICKKMVELNPLQQELPGMPLLEDLPDVTDAFLKYADAIYKMQAELCYVRLSGDTLNANDRIVQLDSNRTSAHNNAMAKAKMLNRWCQQSLGLPKFIDVEDDAPRGEWRVAILEVVRQFVESGNH